MKTRNGAKTVQNWCKNRPSPFKPSTAYSLSRPYSPLRTPTDLGDAPAKPMQPCCSEAMQGHARLRKPSQAKTHDRTIACCAEVRRSCELAANIAFAIVQRVAFAL